MDCKELQHMTSLWRVEKIAKFNNGNEFKFGILRKEKILLTVCCVLSMAPGVFISSIHVLLTSSRANFLMISS